MSDSDAEEDWINPLFEAGKRGDLSRIKQLEQDHQLTPVQLQQIFPITAGYGHLSATQYLVSRGVDVSHPYGQYHAFGNSCRYGRVPVMKYLLDHGSEPHHQNYYGYCHAARENQLEILQYLTEKCGVDVSIRDNLPIQAAAETGSYDTLEYLLQRGADPNSNNGFPVYASIEQGNIQQLQLLVKHGAEVEDPHLLIIAGINHHFEMLEHLLKHYNLDVTHRDSQVTLYVIDSGNLGMAKWCLENYPELDWTNRNRNCWHRPNSRLMIPLLDKYRKQERDANI